jgi:hypothetical protein
MLRGEVKSLEGAVIDTKRLSSVLCARAVMTPTFADAQLQLRRGAGGSARPCTALTSILFGYTVGSDSLCEGF